MSFPGHSERPAYRRQKRPSGDDLAFVVIDGVRHYLGPYDDPASRERYERTLAEQAAGVIAAAAGADRLTVTDLCIRFQSS